jgi:hypothetical protein
MKKLKYQGGLTKLIASKIGERNKVRFANFIELNLNSLVARLGYKPMQVEVVSFSSSKDFHDQVLSILSFLRYVGTPICWTIYSDGSHTPDQIQLLNSGFEFIKVEAINWASTSSWIGKCKLELLPYREHLLDYAQKQPLGKRLFLYLNREIMNPTLFLDSDILFYNKASVLSSVLKEEANGWYLPDENWGCLDSRYRNSNSDQLYQVNGGLILLNKNLVNLSIGLDFLKSLNNEYEYFSEQTVMHILLRANNFFPLDPRIFILNSSDQFDFSYLYGREEIAIRHYSGPVRHKMWQRDWEWQLSLQGHQIS